MKTHGKCTQRNAKLTIGGKSQRHMEKSQEETAIKEKKLWFDSWFCMPVLKLIRTKKIVMIFCKMAEKIKKKFLLYCWKITWTQNL